MGRVESYCCDMCGKIVNSQEKIWREMYQIDISGGHIFGNNEICVCVECGDKTTLHDLRHKVKNRDNQTLKLVNEKHLCPDWGGKQRDKKNKL